MNVMMFEDKATSASSRLISYAYKDDENTVLVFCNGGPKVRSKLADVYREGDRYIIYLDMLPDNKMTRKEYFAIKRLIRKNNYRDVYVLPIICMEYNVIKTFLKNECWYESLVTFIKTEDLTQCINYENYCKKMLGQASYECIQPRNECNKDNLHLEMFYDEDCSCSGCNFTGITLLHKAWRLISCLPAFFRNETVDFAVHEVSLQNVESNCINKYNMLVDTFYKNEIIESCRDLKIGI